MSKSAAVFGATGDQGSSVVDALLADGWKVTGFTRDPSSSNAKKLSDKGVNVVKGDLDDPITYQDALKGQDAVFINADFWSIYLNNGYNAASAKEGEIKQAKAAIQAAVDAGVKHIVYSTLDGDNGVVHWESKSEVSKWTRENNYPVTNLYLSFYFSGILKYNMVKENEDGTFTLGLPGPDHTLVPGVVVEQTGDWVVAALNHPEKWIGKDLYAKVDTHTIAELAQILSNISGKTVKTGNIPEQYFLTEDFRKAIGKELWDNWKMFYDGKLKRDASDSEGIIAKPLDFEGWARQNQALKKILGY